MIFALKKQWSMKKQSISYFIRFHSENSSSTCAIFMFKLWFTLFHVCVCSRHLVLKILLCNLKQFLPANLYSSNLILLFFFKDANASILCGQENLPMPPPDSSLLLAASADHRVFACICNSLTCSASISAIRDVLAHSMRNQLLSLGTLNGDNGDTSKVENQVAGKRRLSVTRANVARNCEDNEIVN